MQMLIFADDTSVFVTDKSPRGLQVKLQAVVDKLASWFDSWTLAGNHRKSALMVLTTRRSVPALNVSLAGDVIQQATSHKHLGLTLDCHFSWSQHTLRTLLQKLHARLACYVAFVVACLH